MKQYLTPEQTAKLIELGFEKPKSSVECDLPAGDWRIGAVGIRKAYSIGELIEMLPCRLGTGEIYIDFNGLWRVGYRNTVLHKSEFELIDALYEMAIKLKEEGVI